MNLSSSALSVKILAGLEPDTWQSNIFLPGVSTFNPLIALEVPQADRLSTDGQALDLPLHVRRGDLALHLLLRGETADKDLGVLLVQVEYGA